MTSPEEIGQVDVSQITGLSRIKDEQLARERAANQTVEDYDRGDMGSPEGNNINVNVNAIVGLPKVKDELDAKAREEALERSRQQAGMMSLGEGSYVEDKVKEESKPSTPVKIEYRPLTGPARPNPLRDYANYTYNLSFHVVPPEIYNKMTTTKDYVYIPKDSKGNGTVLIASAGRRDLKNFARHPEFNEDFYFEQLKFTTVVGMNSRGRHANAIEVNFTLVEPYGFTLINRLLKIAAEIGTKSWMQIPFLLQIDFVGNSDQGDVLHPIPNQTKYIPVKMIGCKSKVSHKGAEYQIQCVPFNHQAFLETTATTPALFEIQATTVKDFFSATGSAGEADNIIRVRKAGKERQEQIAKEIEEEKKKNSKSSRIAELEKQSNALAKDVQSIGYQVGSYAAAINSFQKQLVTNNHIKVPEEYNFVFDPEFADSKIVLPKKTSANRTQMLTLNTPGGIAAIRAQAGLPSAGANTSVENFAINAGTNILEVISMVMRNSEFIRNQIIDPTTETPENIKIPVDGQSAADKAGRPIIWFKVVPILELKDFDLKRDTYAKKVTYYIKKYIYYNTKFRDAPKARPSYNCKEYHYMYSGKNESILSFDIDFDIMFYTAITADRSKIQVSTVQTKEQDDKKDDSGTANKPISVTNNVTYMTSGQADQVNSASPDSKGTLVNDFSKSVMSSSRGDMINVNLKIIGDPELIKQDDIFYNPENNPNQRTDLPIDPKSNSIIFDASETFALLTFRTPKDIDLDTGFMNFDDVEYSVFSGVYKIITVDNEFSKGQFTQTLQMVRLFDQPDWDTLDGKNIKRRRTSRFDEPQDVKKITVADQTNLRDPPVIPPTAPTPALTTQFDEFAGVDQAIAYQEQLNSIERSRERQALISLGVDEPQIPLAVQDEQARLRKVLDEAPALDYSTLFPSTGVAP